MKSIYSLVSQDLSYIYGERESGPNGAKKQFHAKSAAFLRALGNDVGLKEFKVSHNYGGIAVSGDITLTGLWAEGNGVYFQLCQSAAHRLDFLYRGTSHMKDYSGGLNQWMDAALFEAGDYAAVLGLLLTLRKSTGSASAVMMGAAANREAAISHVA